NGKLKCSSHHSSTFAAFSSSSTNLFASLSYDCLLKFTSLISPRSSSKKVSTAFLSSKVTSTNSNCSKNSIINYHLFNYFILSNLISFCCINISTNFMSFSSNTLNVNILVFTGFFFSTCFNVSIDSFLFLTMLIACVRSKQSMYSAFTSKLSGNVSIISKSLYKPSSHSTISDSVDDILLDLFNILGFINCSNSTDISKSYCLIRLLNKPSNSCLFASLSRSSISLTCDLTTLSACLTIDTISLTCDSNVLYGSNISFLILIRLSSNSFTRLLIVAIIFLDVWIFSSLTSTLDTCSSSFSAPCLISS